MTLPLSSKELRFYNNVPTTPLTQKLGDTINELVAGNAYQVDDMAARNALTPTDKQVVRVKSTGELFVYDATSSIWRNVPNSSTRPDFFFYDDSFASVLPIHVTPTGSDADGEGTQTNPFRTVARALDSVPTGYKARIVVAVAGGNYPDLAWHFPKPASVGPNDTAVGILGAPRIDVIGQSPYADGEAINLSGAALTANNAPHPSGLGNYACQSDFNFPAYTTPINPADPKGQHLLFGPSTAVDGVYVTIFPIKVVYSGDNTTGVTRLVNKSGSNLFATGDYYLIHRDQLPTFDSLIYINNQGGENFYGIVSVYACKFRAFTFGFDFGIQSTNVNITGCFIESSGISYQGNNSITAVLSNSIVEKSPTAFGGQSWISGSSRGGYQECYFKDMKVNVTTGQYFNLGGVYESTASQVKLVTGTDDTSTSHGAGPSVGISYFGGCDFIGPGIAMQLVNTSVRASIGSGNFTFDGVDNPLILTSGSFWGHLNVTAIGTCTAPVIVGTKSMTGSGFITNQTGPGIAGWTVSNTANPGQEVQVGANPAPPVGFAALPQTDLALGNTSIGAIAR